MFLYSEQFSCLGSILTLQKMLSFNLKKILLQMSTWPIHLHIILYSDGPLTFRSPSVLNAMQTVKSLIYPINILSTVIKCPLTAATLAYLTTRMCISFTETEPQLAAVMSHTYCTNTRQLNKPREVTRKCERMSYKAYIKFTSKDKCNGFQSLQEINRLDQSTPVKELVSGQKWLL